MSTSPREELPAITHPDKVLFPDAGITKAELAQYYEALAPLMLKHVRGRPVTLERYPAGIDKKGFIQKDVSKGFPDWLERVEAPKKVGTVWYPLANDVRALLWMANQNSITPHVWSARVPDLHNPDLCVFDLDPSQDEPEALRMAALSVRSVLDELGLPSWVKTSGSKGFHIVVPLDGKSGFESVGEFAHGVGALLVQRDPEQLTLEFIKSERAGRILVDTGRNGYSATFAAAYAVRARPGAPVSAPCTWEEVERGSVAPRTFTLRNMRERAAEVGDIWERLHERPASLGVALERLRRLVSNEAWHAGVAASRRKGKKRTPKKPVT